MESPSDEMLVSRCLEGDTRAFGTLVERYQRVMYNVALRVVKRREDAEDAVQSAFVKAYSHLDRFNPEFRFYSWLYRIAMNEALNASRSGRTSTSLPDSLQANDGLPDMDLQRSEATRQIEDGLMELSPEDRAIILLKHFEGFSYDDIAYIFDISSAKVKSRLFTARQRLKSVLVSSGYSS